MGYREPLVARLYTDLGRQASASCQPPGLLIVER